MPRKSRWCRTATGSGSRATVEDATDAGAGRAGNPRSLQHRGHLQQDRPGACAACRLPCRAARSSRLLGSNGAGKSTTLKAISRLLEIEDGAVTGGAIRFNGADIATLSPHALVRSGLFHVMEGRRIFEDLTVEENLTAATFALGGRRRGRRISTSSSIISRACTSAAPGLQAICPAASSRCWRSVAR